MGKIQKGGKDAASIRVRENQRRSRARRKQYVHELESRLIQLQEQGIKATQEVQAAGRRAAEENKRLRSLLGLHGVTDVEIEDYVYPESKKASSAPIPHAVLPLPTSLMQQTPPDGGTATRIGNCSAELQPYSSHDEPPQNEPQKQGSLSIPEGEGIISKAGNVRNNVVFGAPHFAQSLDIDGVGESSPPEIPLSTSRSYNAQGEVTSCETAASIIAGMRGYRGVDEAREELGCNSATCTVKNMTLFDMLDR